MNRRLWLIFFLFTLPFCVLFIVIYALNVGGQEPPRTIQSYTVFYPDTALARDMTRVELDRMLRRILREELRGKLKRNREAHVTLDTLRKFIEENCIMERTQLNDTTYRFIMTTPRYEWHGYEWLKRHIDESYEPPEVKITVPTWGKPDTAHIPQR